MSIPKEIHPESTLIIEPRIDLKQTLDLPRPNIIEAVGGKVRIPNDTRELQVVRKNEHLCHVHLVSAEIDNSNATLPYTTVPTAVRTIGINNKPTYRSSAVKLDPDNILPSNNQG